MPVKYKHAGWHIDTRYLYFAHQLILECSFIYKYITIISIIDTLARHTTLVATIKTNEIVNIKFMFWINLFWVFIGTKQKTHWNFIFQSKCNSCTDVTIVNEMLSLEHTSRYDIWEIQMHRSILLKSLLMRMLAYNTSINCNESILANFVVFKNVLTLQPWIIYFLSKHFYVSMSTDRSHTFILKIIQPTKMYSTSNI